MSVHEQMTSEQPERTTRTSPPIVTIVCAGIAFVVLSIIGIWLVFYNHNSMLTMHAFNAEDDVMVSINDSVKLERLESTLKTLQYQLNQQEGELLESQLQPIHAQVALLKDDYSALMTTYQQEQDEKQEIENALLQTKQQVQSEISRLNDEVQVLRQLVILPEELPTTALPFQILSIDYWHGQPFAAIQMREHIALMTIQDARLGWRLIDVSIDQQQATFVNQHDQMVKVIL